MAGLHPETAWGVTQTACPRQEQVANELVVKAFYGAPSIGTTPCGHILHSGIHFTTHWGGALFPDHSQSLISMVFLEFLRGL